MAAASLIFYVSSQVKRPPPPRIIFAAATKHCAAVFVRVLITCHLLMSHTPEQNQSDRIIVRSIAASAKTQTHRVTLTPRPTSHSLTHSAHQHHHHYYYIRCMHSYITHKSSVSFNEGRRLSVEKKTAATAYFWSINGF